jgi:hypothetical protein
MRPTALAESWGEGVVVFTPDTHAGIWQASTNGGTATPALQVDRKEYTT